MQADFNIKQVENPTDNRCDSGHVPPESFLVGQERIPTRFFSVNGKGIHGIYCELCLTVANYVAKQNKGKK
jgi:hypothetical protein